MNTYGIIIRLFGMITLLAAASVHRVKIHEQLTDEEVAKLFHTTRDKIPEYDVVPVKHNLHKRSNRNLHLQFNAFGRQMYAYLEPSDGKLAGKNTPVWLVHTKPNGQIEYKKLRKDIVGTVASLFTGPVDLSTVVVNEAKGRKYPSFQGMVDGMVIRPLPARLQNARRFRRKIEELDANSTLLDTHYHVIIKSSTLKEEQKLRQLDRQIREAAQSANKSDVSKMKRST